MSLKETNTTKYIDAEGREHWILANVLLANGYPVTPANVAALRERMRLYAEPRGAVLHDEEPDGEMG